MKKVLENESVKKVVVKAIFELDVEVSCALIDGEAKIVEVNVENIDYSNLADYIDEYAFDYLSDILKRMERGQNK